jgi:hypothetical protein
MHHQERGADACGSQADRTARGEGVRAAVFGVLCLTLFAVYAQGQWRWTAGFLKSVVRALWDAAGGG